MAVGKGRTRWGSVPYHSIAFPDSLPNQAKFSIFKVTYAAMRHMRRSCRCTRTKINPVDQQHIDTIERQVTESTYSISSPHQLSIHLVNGFSGKQLFYSDPLDYPFKN